MQLGQCVEHKGGLSRRGWKVGGNSTLRCLTNKLDFTMRSSKEVTGLRRCKGARVDLFWR